MEKEEIQKRIAHLSQVIASKPNSAEALLERGCLYIKAEDYNRALADFSGVLRLEPKNIPALVQASYACNLLADYEASVLYSSRALEIDGDRLEPLVNRGIAKLRLEEWAEAEVDLSKAAALDPTCHVALVALSEAQESLGHWEAAFRSISSAIAAMPSDPNLLLHRAEIIGDWIPEQAGQALKDLNRALELDKECGDAYLLRARFRKHSGDHRGALEDVVYASKYESLRYESECLRSNILVTLGRPQEAMVALNSVISIYPKYAKALAERAEVHYSLKDFPGCIADCDAALAINPKLCNAYLIRATAKALLGQYDKAIHDVDLAEKVLPKERHNRQVMSHAIEELRTLLRK
jgi:tetratricopeptide (TPR) repeat protein